MKKILFVATVPEHFRYFHLPCFRMLQEHGFEVHTACSAPEEFPYTDRQFVVPMGRNPWDPQNVQGYKQLKKIINDGGYDIVHCHTPMGGTLGRVCSAKARKKGTRVIYTAHGFHFYKGAPKLNWLLFFPIEGVLSCMTDVLITINEEDYRRARRFFHAQKTAYVHGVGCDTTRFYRADGEVRAQMRSSLGLRDSDTVLVYVAEQNANKNQGLLIRAVEALLPHYPNLKLLLVGPDHIDGAYEAMAKASSAPVVFTGERHDIPQILSVCDIYTASSLREGLPVNVMEAMSAGLPVLAFNNRGHRALVQDGKTGLLADTQTEFTDKLEKLLEDAALRSALARAGKAHIADYDLQKVLAELGEIYFV